MKKASINRELKFAQPALDDLTNIQAWTLEHFGLPAMQRYDALIFLAAEDIRDIPDRLGVTFAHEGNQEELAYHLRFSSKRLPKGNKVAHPRHFIIFSIDENAIDVKRILHDSMDIESQLSDEADE
jgi:toxin ParE1/3/4